jgi:calcium-dependent protein kinase
MKIRKKSIKKNFKKNRVNNKKKKKLKTFKKRRVINKKKKTLKTFKKRGGGSSTFNDTVCIQSTSCNDKKGIELGKGANSIVYNCLNEDECKPIGKKIIAITKDAKVKSLQREKKGFEMQKKIYNLVLESPEFDKSNIPIPEISYCGECSDIIGRPYKIEEKSGEELYERIKKGKISMHSIRKLFFPIFKLLKVMHTNGYAHRDIKAENILIHGKDQTDQSLKLIDFGFAQKKGVEIINGFKNICGTPNYLAPEMFHLLCSIQAEKEHRMYGGKLQDMFGPKIEYYDEKCDLFSIGVLLFECANGVGFLPFTPIFSSGRHGQRISNYKTWKHVHRNFEFYFLKKKKKSNDESRELTDLIKNLLHPDPKKRISAEDALKHDFFNEKNNIEEITKPKKNTGNIRIERKKTQTKERMSRVFSVEEEIIV